jgi:hypothetical protein
MQSIAFTAPLLPGKTATAREAMHSCMQGERKAAYDASRQRLGIARESVWIQQTPGGDFAIVYLEADDLQAAFGGLATSQVPFDHWFREHTREIHGCQSPRAIGQQIATTIRPPDGLKILRWSVYVNHHVGGTIPS